MKVIIRKYQDFPLEFAEMAGNAKVIANRRVSSIRVYEATDKNVSIMNEYNLLNEQMEKLADQKEALIKAMEKEIK